MPKWRKCVESLFCLWRHCATRIFSVNLVHSKMQQTITAVHCCSGWIQQSRCTNHMTLSVRQWLYQSMTASLKPMTHLKVSWEGHLHKKLSQENKKTCASYLQKFYMTHLQVEQRKMQVKSGVSWERLCCDSDWPITAHRLWKKTSRNRTRSISESWLSQV